MTDRKISSCPPPPTIPAEFNPSAPIGERAIGAGFVVGNEDAPAEPVGEKLYWYNDPLTGQLASTTDPKNIPKAPPPLKLRAPSEAEWEREKELFGRMANEGAAMFTAGIESVTASAGMVGASAFTDNPETRRLAAGIGYGLGSVVQLGGVAAGAAAKSRRNQAAEPPPLRTMPGDAVAANDNNKPQEPVPFAAVPPANDVLPPEEVLPLAANGDFAPTLQRDNDDAPRAAKGGGGKKPPRPPVDQPIGKKPSSRSKSPEGATPSFATIMASVNKIMTLAEASQKLDKAISDQKPLQEIASLRDAVTGILIKGVTDPECVEALKSIPLKTLREALHTRKSALNLILNKLASRDPKERDMGLVDLEDFKKDLGLFWTDNEFVGVVAPSKENKYVSAMEANDFLIDTLADESKNETSPAAERRYSVVGAMNQEISNSDYSRLVELLPDSILLSPKSVGFRRPSLSPIAWAP